MNIFILNSSPKLQSRKGERDTQKDDIWAFGIFILVLCSGGKFPSKSDLKPGKYNKSLAIIENLNTSREIKSIISNCLIEDENERADSKRIYQMSKDYCENIYRLNAKPSLSEKLYYQMIGYNFISKSVPGQDKNLLMKFKGRKNKCLICFRNEPGLKKYRKFHKVHQKCLFIQLKNNLKSLYCLICNNINFESEAHQTLGNFTVNMLTYKDCFNPGLTLKSFNENRSAECCNHFLSALTENYKSAMFMCPKVNRTFCTLCSNSEYHIHCAGYLKHLEQYKKAYILDEKENKKVYLLKYQLVYWQKVLKETRFREYQIMEKIQKIEEDLSFLHIYDYCCTFNDNFLFLDFWYCKNPKSENIRVFFEYMEDGSLDDEYKYRNNNKIRFEDEEILLYQNFIQNVTTFLEGNFIFHTNISMSNIYIHKSLGKITKFKLSGMRYLIISEIENEENKLKHVSNSLSILQSLQTLHNP